MKIKRNISVHEDYYRVEKVHLASDRSFGIVFACFFAVVSLLSFTRGGQLWALWLGGAAVFALLALFQPRLLAPLNGLWMKLGALLFKIVSPVMLALLFYACIAPIGIVLRFMKKDILNLHRNANAQTYWITRTPPGPDPDTLKNQY